MNLVRGAAVAFVLSAANPIQAAESVTGRWAVDLEACTRFLGVAPDLPLTVTDNSLRWSDDACRIERSYKTGDTIHIQANCWGNGGVRSIPVSLRPHGGRLAVTWDRGARGELKRCP
jgi:hypothetical protein